MSFSSDIGIIPGTFVISKQGRDKMRPFVVLEVVDADYVLIADGNIRRVEKPKLKKIKHLNVSTIKAKGITEKLSSGEKVSDVELRKAIADFSFERWA